MFFCSLLQSDEEITKFSRQYTDALSKDPQEIPKWVRNEINGIINSRKWRIAASIPQWSLALLASSGIAHPRSANWRIIYFLLLTMFLLRAFATASNYTSFFQIKASDEKIRNYAYKLENMSTKNTRRIILSRSWRLFAGITDLILFYSNMSWFFENIFDRHHSMPHHPELILFMLVISSVARGIGWGVLNDYSTFS